MNYETILFDVNNGVATLTLNRPDVYNAFNEQLSSDVNDALKKTAKDKSIRVLIITGAGKAFCSGQDLKSISGSKNRSLSESLYKRYNPMIKAIRNLPIPVVCKLNGVAAGAGCSLALACDLIYASENASLIEVFVNVGLVLDSGSSYFLPRLIGSARAFELATLGSKVSAQQAADWGMINKVVKLEELDTEVNKVADYYSTAPTKAIGLMKKMLNKSFSSDLDTMLEYEAFCQEIAGRSEDYHEGVTAFVEKRKANFTGR
ncbi:MAG: enoyl-CoA hydratase/isomerase family protein [Bacteroidia bacterium]|nr:enoyl-CoA hydratase/isomerase family protein [Bacteroidia bacterium]MCF8426295.1 enoyl-CoA hydratase/isomerase family protein [Bacteroidia bacterium]MCF8446571.1 enoyl-CoA hydratase/isomerase family protein [Bacteroidia bacterium]